MGYWRTGSWHTQEHLTTLLQVVPVAAPLLLPSSSPHSRRLGLTGPSGLWAPDEGLAPATWLAVQCGKLYKCQEGSGRTDGQNNEREG